MTDDTPKLSDLAGIFAGDDSGPRSRCTLCRDTIGWSAERAEGDICRDCAETIADPEMLRTLAQRFDNPNQTKAVVCLLGDEQYPLGVLFCKVAHTIETQAGTTVAEPGQ